LAVIRNSELDLEEQRIRGEIATINARVAAIRATRIDHDRRSPAATSSGQLAAEEEELKQSLASLTRQLEIVNRRLRELTLRSPMAGQVVRWDMIRSLESRPVRQGQLLMQIVDPAGPWEIELHIPDRTVRHVLAAQAAQNPIGLPVRFLFRMSPNTTYSATLERVNLATDLDQDGELSTLATVNLNAKDIPDLRPGSSVIAKIDCGRRSLGYVWLRELLEFLQIHVFF
jgi:multidrug efflux pump subunit AcrA (membrane-fusion protein)